MENETSFPRASASSIFYSLGSIALVIIFLLYFAGIMKPLVMAILISFIINQLSVLIGRITIKGKALPFGIRSVLSFLIVFMISFLLIELLIKNLEGIAASMPEYLSNLHKYVDQAGSLLNDPKYVEYLQKWVDGIDIAAVVSSLVNSFSGFVASFAVVLVYVIFLLLENASRKAKVKALFPQKGKKYDKFVHNMGDISQSIRSYLWQKTAISLITGIVSFVILLILGVEYAFLWSFLIFAFNFIPYLGPLISSLFPAIFAMLITSDPMQFVYVFAALESVQIVLGSFLEPKMMGRGTNLGPVIVIVALALWGMIWGIVGMILAVPITSVLVIILSQIPSTRYMAILLSEKGNISNMQE